MTRMDAGAPRRAARFVALCQAAALLALGAPALAQAPSSAPPSPPPVPDLCVATIDEVDALTGMTFERMASGPANCAYEGGPDEAPYLLDLHLEDPGYGFQQFDDPSDRMAGYQFVIRGSEATTIGDRLAWLGPDGLAVDMGGQVLVVEPILVFVADPPDPLSFLPPLGELVVERLPEVIPAVPATPFPMEEQ